MGIAVGFNYWDSLAGVQRAVNSFKDHVDLIIGVYGKYDTFEGDPDEFIESKKWLETIPNFVSLEYHGKQQDKRNRYLIACEGRNIDTLIILDSDEWIEGDWDEFYSNMKEMFAKYPNQTVFGMKGTINRTGDWSWYPRVWRNPSNFRYYNSHCVVKEGNQIYHLKAQTAQKYLIDGLLIWHNDDNRTREFWERDQAYQKRQISEEKPTRMKYK